MRERANESISDDESARLFGALDSFPTLVLAVSGGPDSTALMWLAARWRARFKHPPKLIAVTVDHGLRKESAREALAVKRLAKKLKVEHRTLRWTGKKPKTGIQEAARNARYRLLSDAASEAGARHILTAHTLDDQAETVLFRMARGSGVSGLRGMRPKATLSPVPSPERGGSIAEGDRGGVAVPKSTPTRRASLAGLPLAGGGGELLLIRPLLSIPKARLLATLAAAGIPFADDRSNRDPRFTRPRLRQLMPALATEGLDATRLAAFARRMARADAALERAVDDAVARLAPGPWPRAGPIILNAEGYAALPSEVALRLLGWAIGWAGDEGPVELAKLEALHDALQESDGVRFRRTLAGALITVQNGTPTAERAPPRRSGAKSGTAKRKGAFTKPR